MGVSLNQSKVVSLQDFGSEDSCVGVLNLTMLVSLKFSSLKSFVLFVATPKRFQAFFLT